MATQSKTIEYIFVGDVSSLQKAVTSSVNLMGLLGKSMASATINTINFVESVNLFNTATAGAQKVATQFVDSMAEIYGLDPKSIMDSVGTMYLLTDAIRMPAEASTQMALNLTKAANDVASLYNSNIQQVTSNFESAMMGMSRAVRKYGFDVSAAALQQTAYTLGLNQSVSAMSEADKRALIYITMMNQMHKSTQQVVYDANGAAVVMGDFARTIESPANQLRILKEQIAQLGRAIGSFFIGPLSVAIQYVNGFIMALRSVLSFIAKVLSIFNIFSDTAAPDFADTTEAVTAGIGDIGGAASGTAKELQKMLAPFDELNVLQKESADAAGGGGGGGGGVPEDLLNPALLDAINGMSLGLDNIKMKAAQIRDQMLEFLGFKIDNGQILGWDPDSFERNLIDKFPQWTKTIQATFDHWSEIIDGFKAVFASIWHVIQKIWDRITGFLSKFINDDSVSTFIEKLGGRLQKLADWIDQHSDLLAGLIIGFVAMRTVANLASSGLIGPLNRMSDLLELSDLLGISVSAVASLLGGLGLAAGGAVLEFGGLTNVVREGIDWDNLLTSIAGAGGITSGGALIGAAFGEAALGGGVGAIIGGIPLAIVGIWDAIKNGIKWLNASLGALGTTLIGAGIGLFFGPIGAAIGALVGLVVGLLVDLVTLIVQKWEAISTWITNAATAIGQFFTDIWHTIQAGWSLVAPWLLENVINPIKNFFTEGFNFVVGIFVGIWEKIVEVFSPIVQWWSKLFKSLWETVKDVGYDIYVIVDGVWQIIKKAFKIVADWFDKNVVQPLLTYWKVGWEVIKTNAEEVWNRIKTVWNVVSSWFDTHVLTPLKSAFKLAWDVLVLGAQTAWNAIKQVFSTVATFFENVFSEAWAKVVKVFSVAGDIFNNIKDAIVTAFKKIVNGLITGINSVVALPFQALNSALLKLKYTTILGIQPFINLKTISVPSIPYLAKGGVVSKPTLAMIGEGAYSEGILPLDDSPQMTKLVNRIAEAVEKTPRNGGSGDVYMDGIKVGQIIRRANNFTSIMYGVD